MDDVSLIERGFEEFPATIALLDSRGDIVYTNRSWRAFADANDYAGDPDSTGVNYLAVCDAARGTDEIAGVVADGIRAVLRGDRDLFTAEYPCHSPAVYRWFALRVVPIDTPRHGSFALVSHFDITDRRLAELQVNEKTSTSRRSSACSPRNSKPSSRRPPRPPSDSPRSTATPR